MKNPPPNRKISASSRHKTAIATLLLVFSYNPGSPFAQAPAPIIESGLNTQVSGAINVGGNTQYNITGGTRPSNGANVFHSFGEFGVPLNTIANFQNDASLPTTNILSRVTGTKPSNISGTIRTQGFGDANLFLLNPNGVVFGANASLDLNGSFHVSTADFIQLGESSGNAMFSASDPDNPSFSLSSAPPSAFGFSASNPFTGISVNSTTLRVDPGKVISIIGGDPDGLPQSNPQGAMVVDTQPGILVSGSASKIIAPGGQINLVSVASKGEVAMPGMALTGFDKLGTTEITNQSMIDVRGIGIQGGQVVIRGGRLTLDNQAQIVANTTGASNAGSVDIEVSENVTITGTNNQETQSGIFTDTTGDGNAGTISVTAQDVEIKDGGQIFTSSRSLDGNSAAGKGAGGKLIIDATGTLSLSGVIKRPGPGQRTFQSALISSTEGQGNAGDIMITAGNVSLNKGGVIQANTKGRGSGNAGNVTINTPNGNLTLSEVGLVDFNGQIEPRVNIISSNVNEFDTESGATILGSGGRIKINAKSVSVQDGSKIRAAVFGARGAQEDLNSNQTLPSAGIVDITTDSLMVSGGSLNAAGNRTPSEIGVGVSPPANAGEIHVKAATIEVLDGARISAETESKTLSNQRGIIKLTATKLLEVSGAVSKENNNVDTSAIVARTSGVANAGDILIEDPTNNLMIMVTDGGQIANSTLVGKINGELTNPGAGGNITITARTISVKGRSSEGAGDNFSQIASLSRTTNASGQITVNAGDLTIEDGGFISTDTLSGGPGGDLMVNVEKMLTLNGVNAFSTRPGDVRNSRISTSTKNGAGPAGNIRITAQNIMLKNGASIQSNTADPGSGAAGNVTITATENITLSGFTRITPPEETRDIPTAISSSASIDETSSATGTESLGSGGTISLTAKNVKITDGAKIQAEFLDTRKQDQEISTPQEELPSAGNIDIMTNTLTVSGGFIREDGNPSPSEINVGVRGPGRVGNIEVTADTIEVLGGAQIAAETASKTRSTQPGSISVTARQSLLVDGSSSVKSAANRSRITARTTGVEDAGNILIKDTNNVMVSNGGRIENSTTVALKGNGILENPGKAGNLTINAGTIAITGELAESTTGSSIVSVTRTSSPGGKISLVANNINITNGGSVSAGSFDAPERNGTGDGGTIDLTATDSILLSRARLSSESNGKGNAGTITATADAITLQTAKIESFASGTGNAGDIKITGNKDILLDNAELKTNSTKMLGGDIKLDAPDLIFIKDSRIESSVQGDGTTKGGNISIDPQFIVITNSQIEARANTGSGGAINLVSDVVFIDRLDSLDASAGDAGIDGTVNIEAPIQNIAQAIAPLPETIIEVAALYSAQCAGQKNGQFSSFTQPGLDRIPFEPGELLPTPLFIPDLTSDQSNTRNTRATPMVQRLEIPGLDSPKPLATTWKISRSGCRS